jgi:hypothetical protein
MARIGNDISNKVCLSVDVGEGNVGATLCKSFDVVNQNLIRRGIGMIPKDAVYKKFRVSLNWSLMKTLMLQSLA